MMVQPIVVQPIRVGPPASAGGFATITDTFTRADSTTSLGVTDTGQTWSVLGASGPFGISSNQGYLATDGNPNANAAVVESAIADATVAITFSVVAAGVRLAFRFTDVDNGFIVDTEANRYVLYRRQAGVYTQIDVSTGVTPTNGDVVSAVLSGTAITIKVNGTTRISATDSFNQSATKHGIAANTTSAGRFDDLSITSP